MITGEPIRMGVSVGRSGVGGALIGVAVGGSRIGVLNGIEVLVGGMMMIDVLVGKGRGVLVANAI